MVPRISNALNLLLIVSAMGALIGLASGFLSPGVPDKASLDAALSELFRSQTSLVYGEDLEIVISLLLLICLVVLLVSIVLLFLRKSLGIILYTGAYAFMWLVMGIFWWNHVNYEIGFLDMIYTMSTMADGAILFICWYLPVEAGFAAKRGGSHPETAFL